MKLQRYPIFILLFTIATSHAGPVLDNSMSNWKTLNATAPFSLNTPANSLHIPQQGIDSQVGIFKTPDFELSYDYGLYSPKMENNGRYQNYNTQKITVAGKTALIIRAYDPSKSSSKPWLSALYIANVKPAPALGKISLSLFGWLAEQEDYTTSELIFKSVILTD